MTAANEVLPGVFDWSTVHQASSDAFFTPIQDQSDCSGFKWSKELVEQFWRDGYVSNVPIFTPEQVDKLIQDYDYFTGEKKHPGMELMYEYHRNQTGDPNNVLAHALGHWRLTQQLHDIVFHPKVVVPCSALLAEGQEIGVRFWHDQLFAKPAHHGGNVAWHQDYSYWTRTKPCKHITVHIALDEQTEENGTLKYVPGSHRWTRNGGDPLPVLDFNFIDMEGVKSILDEEELAAFQPVSALLKKGEASFHHPLSMHGSYGNRSSVPRRALVLNYFADGVISNTDDFLLKKNDGKIENYDKLFGAANIPKGKKLEGQFFPLVYDPSWCK